MITVSENRAAPRHTGVQQCYARSRETPCCRVANPFLEVCLWVPDVFLFLFFELFIFFRSGGSVSTSFPPKRDGAVGAPPPGGSPSLACLGMGEQGKLGTIPCGMVSGAFYYGFLQCLHTIRHNCQTAKQNLQFF